MTLSRRARREARQYSGRTVTITNDKIFDEPVYNYTRDFPYLWECTLQELRRRYFVDSANLEPRAYWRLTDHWLELGVRFVTRERGVREVKDALSRDVLTEQPEVRVTLEPDRSPGA